LRDLALIIRNSKNKKCMEIEASRAVIDSMKIHSLKNEYKINEDIFTKFPKKKFTELMFLILFSYK